MRTIDADKVIEKLKEHKSLFCKNRDEFKALSDKDKARVDEIDTCIAELVNAEGVQTTNTDTISRQAAIDAVISLTYPSSLVDVKRKLVDLPPAQPERIKGHWIPMERKNLFRCSECGAVIYSETEHDRNEFHKSCGRCGAEMEVTT